MSWESDKKRLIKIVLHKIYGSNAWHKKWQSEKYNQINTERIRINSFLDNSYLKADTYCNKNLKCIMEHYMEHRFDYLGSGWVDCGYNKKVLGVEGYQYQAKYKNQVQYFHDLYQVLAKPEVQEIEQWKKKLPISYQYIDWNRDYKSGYSWEIKYLDEVESTNIPKGADVKTVWELGRMEFLLLFAVAAFIMPEKKEEYIKEYKNIVIDFFCSNPTGLGINWILPMEASIRATNLLLAYDILQQLDNSYILDKNFTRYFIKKIYQHGKFIYDNLEKDIVKKSNGNHYYSNLLGLLYISSYLKGRKEIGKWYQFAKKEFLKESDLQFYRDGGNIEASSSYHRLTAEMMVFGIAILIRNGEKINNILKQKIVQAVYLSKVLTKKNGDVLQIGDNDSGRFINVVPYGRIITNKEAEEIYNNLNGYCKIYGSKGKYFDENCLCHNSLLGYLNGLFVCENLDIYKSGVEFETSFLQAIIQRKPEKIKVEYQYNIEREKKEHRLKYSYYKKTEIPCCVIKSREKINWGYFPDFGIYFYKNGEVDFYIYTGGENGRKKIGHSHNDLMHCELCINGKDILLDRGTYLYIENEKRNYFRGREGHFVPDYGREPREITGTFSYKGKEKCQIIEVGHRKISLCYFADNIRHYRVVEIEKSRITINDYGQTSFVVKPDQVKLYSNGYGKLKKLSKKEAL